MVVGFFLFRNFDYFLKIPTGQNQDQVSLEKIIIIKKKVEKLNK